MDEEMEDTVVYTFTAVEIDLDYEFEAARYFDFSREESLAEARESELWFAYARSYPPSPFVTKLVPRGNILLENVDTSPKPKDDEDMSLPDGDSDTELGLGYSVMYLNNRGCKETDGGISTNLHTYTLQKSKRTTQQLPTGLTFYNHTTKDNFKANTKSVVKRSFPRTSTLMKPTASQLAKQNRCHQVGDVRFQKLVENDDKSSNNTCGIESQAAKRQKIAEGHLRKVADTKQQTNLVHKAPNRDGIINGDSMHAKLRLTIPREPDFETAHRAQRMRPKASSAVEHVTSTVRKFKALPLNKKILETPSLLLPKRTTPRLPEFQKFHLKTSERVKRHTFAVSSSSITCSSFNKVSQKPASNSISECGDRESRRPDFLVASKHDGYEKVRNFKALPLNKKIFSSKGDIGVFRNIKKEITVPMEFNFHTDKRVQHVPPTELFDKLSLTSELQPNAGSQLKLPPHTCISAKGSKENRLASFQQEHEMKHVAKERRSRCGSDGVIAEHHPSSGMNRRSGIR